MFELSNEVITHNNYKLSLTEGKSTTKGTILHLHGLPGGPFDNFTSLHHLFVPRGYRMISFNYPGLWEADGYFSAMNAVTSTQEILKFLVDTYNRKLLIFAESFGGSIIAYSLQTEDLATHIFYRAPLPGIEYFLEDKRKLPLLLQSMTMLIQAQVMRLENNSIENALGDLNSKPIAECVETLTKRGIKQMTLTGKNDEILDYKAIQSGFKSTHLKIFDSLSHNNISRNQWIELVTMADIFFQQND